MKRNNSSTTSSFALSLLTIALTFPATLQERPESSPQIFPRSETARNSARLLPLAHQRHGVPDPLGDMAMAAQGNASIEMLAESLARLEGNLSSLIQSFLALQRSVFNLEQLQELLVLLLEDILKQTGNIYTSPRGNQDQNYQNNVSGGRTDDSSDSSDIVSEEIDTDIGEDETGQGDEDRGNGGDQPDTGANGRVTGGSQQTDPLRATAAIGGNENMFGPATSPGVAREKPGNIQPAVDPEGAVSSGSVGGSSEGGGSGSWEDMYGQTSTAARGSANQGNPNYPRSQRPLWSEPLTADTTQDIRTRFQGVVQHIVARFGHRRPTSSFSHHLGMLQAKPDPQSNLPESTLDRPPPFEPLEIVQGRDQSDLKGNKNTPETMPFDVKLRQKSPVVSHGGPLVGPESNSLPFLEHLGTKIRKEDPGERQTGMINNLVQSSKTDQLLTNATQPPHMSPPTVQSDSLTSYRDIRRRRQTISESKSSKPLAVGVMMGGTGDSKTRVIIKSQIYYNQPRDHKVVLTQDLTTPHDNLALPVPSDNSVDPPVHIILDPSHIIHSASTTKSAGNMQPNSGNSTEADYDFLIAALLKDLSNKLHHYHVKQSPADTPSTSDVHKVVSELNKLIWIPADDTNHVQTNINISTPATQQSSILNSTMDTTGIAAGTNTMPWTLAADVTETTLKDGQVPSTLGETTTAKPPEIHLSQHTNTSTDDIPGDHQYNRSKDQSSTHTSISTAHTSPFVITGNPLQSQRQPGNTQENPTAPTKTMADSQDSTPIKPVNSNLIGWEWLNNLTESEETNRTFLIEALNQLSLFEDLAEELQILRYKGWALVQEKLGLFPNARGLIDEYESTSDLEDSEVIKNSEEHEEDLTDDDNFVSPPQDKAGEHDDNQEDDQTDAESTPNTAEKHPGQSVKDEIYNENTIFRDLDDNAGVSGNAVNNETVQGKHNNDKIVRSSLPDADENDGLDKSRVGKDEVYKEELEDVSSSEENVSLNYDTEDHDSYESKESIDHDNTADSDETDNDMNTPYINKTGQNGAALISTDQNAVNDKTSATSGHMDNNKIYDKDEVLDLHRDHDMDINDSEELGGDLANSEDKDKDTDMNNLANYHLQLERPIITARTGETAHGGYSQHGQVNSDAVGELPFLRSEVNVQRRRRPASQLSKRQRRQTQTFWHQYLQANPPTNYHPTQRQASQPIQLYPSHQKTYSNQLPATDTLQSSLSSQMTGQNLNSRLLNNRPMSTHPGHNAQYTNSLSQYRPQYPHANPVNARYPHHATPHYSGHRTSQRQPQQPVLSEYPNYLNFLGLPAWAFPGPIKPEPGEKPTLEVGAPLEFEEILNNLFQQYWQRVNRLYPQPTNPTTVDLDYEGEMTTTTSATTTTSSTSTTTPAMSPAPIPMTSSDPLSVPQDTTTDIPIPQGTQNSVTKGTQAPVSLSTENSILLPDVTGLQASNPTTQTVL